MAATTRWLPLLSTLAAVAGAPACDKFTAPALPPPATGAAPETTASGGPRSRTRNRQMTVVLASNEASATFQCALDNEAFAPCTSPVMRSNIVPGVHVFRAFASLADGRFDATPAILSFEVIGTPVDTAIASAPPATTSSTSAVFSFTSPEPGATFECALDETPFAACTSPASLSGLAAGDHRFRVRALDVEGTRDETPAEHLWTVDATPPAVTIVRAPTGTIDTPSFTFLFVASDETARLYCKLDLEAAAPCASPLTVVGLTPGTHQFSVYAVDGAGNRSTPVSAGFTVSWSNGTACGAASDCQSNFCRDGVCCNEACDGVCKSCALTRGTCNTVRSSVDADTGCIGDNRCDENGACNPASISGDGFELTSSRYRFRGQFPEGEVDSQSATRRFRGKLQLTQ